MLIFEPPELQEQLTKAVKAWPEELEFDLSFDLSDDLDFIKDLCSEDFDPSQYKDIKIDSSYLVEIRLPRWDEVALVSCQEFIDLQEELEGAKLFENETCRSNKRVLTRVEPVNEVAVKFLYHAVPDAEDKQGGEIRKQVIDLREEISALGKKLDELDRNDSLRDEVLSDWLSKRDYEQELFREIKKSTERFCIQNFSSDGVEISCSLTRGFSIFGILIACAGEYDKYFPPILDEDLFVEIRFDKKISKSLEQNIFEAYLFEVSSSLDLSVEISSRPYLDDSWLNEQCDYIFQDPRFRPLILGKGTTELLKLYNKAVSSKDLDVQILYFTKAIEYVSQTVIRIQSNEAIRAKLLSSRALKPDADFISELESIFETQRTYKKDREAIRQTIVTCCEASELAKVAPTFIKEFKQISAESNLQDRNKALEALGKSLYSTRNEIAHAKANYQPTGEECPEDQFLNFTKCVQLATQQVINWYYFSPESIRLT
jgi:hypothetical protein